MTLSEQFSLLLRYAVRNTSGRRQSHPAPINANYSISNGNGSWKRHKSYSTSAIFSITNRSRVSQRVNVRAVTSPIFTPPAPPSARWPTNRQKRSVMWWPCYLGYTSWSLDLGISLRFRLVCLLIHSHPGYTSWSLDLGISRRFRLVCLLIHSHLSYTSWSLDLGLSLRFRLVCLLIHSHPCL